MDRALFGSRLRLARERQGLTLQDLAAQTKLPAALFGALEEGTCQRWPVGVYSRSHVRTYAALVGLDPGEVAAEFSALFPHLAWSEQDQVPEVAAVLRPSGGRPSAGTGAPLRLALADEPMPAWRALLTKLAWRLHRAANGPVVAVAAPAVEEPDLADPAIQSYVPSARGVD